MNYIDLFVGGLLLFGAVKGFFKGLIVEASSVVALVFGIVGALILASTVENLLTNYFKLESVPPAGVIFLLIFVFIIIGVNLFAKFLTRIIKMASLGGINRLLGAFFGATKFALGISALFLLVDQFSYFFQYFDTQILDQSKLYKPLKAFGKYLFEWLLDHKEMIPEKLV